MDYILLGMIKHLQYLPDYMKNCLNCPSYATHALLQCFLQSNYGKNAVIKSLA